MKDFRASEVAFVCEECGEELKVTESIFDEVDEGWWLELFCRGCGPQGREWLESSGTI